MAKEYSPELRAAIMAAYDNGNNFAEIARMFNISRTGVSVFVKHVEKHGTLERKPIHRPDNSKLKPKHHQRIETIIKKKPDITLGELIEDMGIKVSVSTMHRNVDKLGLTRKKKTKHASEQDRPDVKARRENWFEQFRDLLVKNLVFLDEFGTTTAMERAYARGPIGQRVVCKSPQKHWKTFSTIAAMTLEGMLGYATFAGATNTDIFLEFVASGLVPNLKKNQVVVLDNMSVHHAKKVKQLLAEHGIRFLHLPPYSPDYNPIEMAISKIKAYLKKMRKRNTQALMQAIDQAMKRVTREDAKNFIRHAGYSDALVRKAV